MGFALAALLLCSATGCDSPSEEPAAESQPEYEAASDGDPQSQFEIGRKYAVGIGIARDDTEAAKWWLKAARQGHARSMHAIGQFKPCANGRLQWVCVDR